MAIQGSRHRPRLVLIALAAFMGVSVACMPGGNPGGPGEDPGQVAALFSARCGICHGPDGKMGYNNATDLSTSALSRDEVVARILEGKSTMPPFRDLLTADQVQVLTDYTLQLRKGTP